MSKKKTDKKKSPYPENGKVRIRHSYYTFAREFPSKIMPLEGKRRKHRKKRILKNILTGFFFIILMLFSYFTVNLMLDISYTDKEKLDSESETTLTDTQENEPTDPQLSFNGENIKALYMSAERLGDREYIGKFIKEIKRKNCNTVLIDFKNSEGKLSYTSLNENAITAHAFLFDNDTIRKALDLFEEKDIRVIARIYCFKDNAVASTVPSLAVKYMNTDVNWVDSSSEKGGNRLNPLSADARKYIISIIKEVTQFKINGVLLEEVSFPSGENAKNASYPGEKKNSSKHKTLLSFMDDVKKALPENCILLMGHSAKDVLEPNSELYAGSVLTCAADGFAVDTLQRPENVIIDKKTDYASVFSLFSTLKNNIGEKKAVFTVDISEYSASFVRKMQRAGYTDFIIYSSEGVY
ncbi:MAG: hypothetical protein IJB74_04170 [Clostridia bacterium]|nr:hypothetical protein [Clostridia bacterium]